MALPEVGEATMLAILVNKTPSQDLVLKLFVNDVHPASNDDVHSYREANGHGYRAITLSGSAWTITSGHASYPQQTFSFTGPLGGVYGYFVVQEQSGTLMWAECFPNAFIAAQHNQIKISPVFSIAN